MNLTHIKAGAQDLRLAALEEWVQQSLGWRGYSLTPASSDASFRRYFRVTHQGQSYIVMDAPPEKENVRPYIAVAAALGRMSLNVPVVMEQDLPRGFLLLTDLGTRQYLGELNAATVDQLYGDAIQALRRLQAAPVAGAQLPPYNRNLLLNEMGLFRDWLLAKHLAMDMAPLAGMLEGVYALLADSALEQPQVWVHRDYHSRNLMVTAQHNPGILDFQDAVIGPVTYDVVSLLRDCYIRWPREQVERWALGHYQALVAARIIPAVGEAQYLRWFDLMGVQRHLKAAGIFARLNIRDGKPGYLKDIPRTLGYVQEVSMRYPELEGLRILLIEISDKLQVTIDK